MGFADRVPHTNGCLQHCGNKRKALHPVPRVKEAILNTDVNRDWYKWKDKRGGRNGGQGQNFSALLGQMELKYLGTESYG